MSSGGQSTTTTSSLPSWASGAAQQFLGRAAGVSELPYTPYTGPQVAELSPMQRQGMQGLSNMAGGTGYTNAAGNMLTETLQGGGMNPYLGGMTDRIVGDSRRAYDDATGAITARFNRPGNWGGSAHQGAQDRANESFARGTGDALSNLYSGAYQAERGNQMQAANLANSLYSTMGQGYTNAMNAGGLDRQYQQDLYNAQRGNFNEWRDYPNQQLNTFGNAIGAITGAVPRTQTSEGPGPDRFSQGLGAILAGSSLARGNK